MKNPNFIKAAVIIVHCLAWIGFATGQVTDSFRTSDGEYLFFTKQGTGPKVVFLYGGPGFAVNAMKFWADSLSDKFECILFDQRGTGLSSNVKYDSSAINLRRAVQDLDELREYLGEEKLTLCGISWGGMLSQAYASFYPDNTKNIVLVSTPGPDRSLKEITYENIRMRMYPNEKDSIEYWRTRKDDEDASLKITFYIYLSTFYDHELGRNALKSIHKSTTFSRRMSELMGKDINVNYDLKSRLGNYKGECHIIRPRQDHIPAQAVYQIKELVPQTKIYFIERCGHFPDYEQPVEFFGILREVLQ